MFTVVRTEDFLQDLIPSVSVSIKTAEKKEATRVIHKPTIWKLTATIRSPSPHEHECYILLQLRVSEKSCRENRKKNIAVIQRVFEIS